ncbi:MAG: hypothetical protein IJ268_04985 [Proteobacteria bacterium]|nr:hypothetical protein [Pseudomonadota bacterium]
MADFASRNLMHEVIASLQARNRFAPNLRGQSKCFRRLAVPVLPAFEQIGLRRIQANRNIFRNSISPIGCVSLFDGIIDIPIAALAHFLPDKTITFKIIARAAFRLRQCLQQIGNDAILTDIFGNILFSIISPHGRTIVDVLLEYIAQHIGVDILTARSNARVEMPLIGIEECKQTLKRLIGDIQTGIRLLNLMLGKHAAIQIGNHTKIMFKCLISVAFGLIQTIAEQSAQKRAIEAIILPLPLIIMYFYKFIA